jgi:hypothetical protein
MKSFRKDHGFGALLKKAAWTPGIGRDARRDDNAD